MSTMALEAGPIVIMKTLMLSAEALIRGAYGLLMFLRFLC